MRILLGMRNRQKNMGVKTQNINYIDRVNLLMKYSVNKTIAENEISKVQKSYFGPKKTFEKMMNEQEGRGSSIAVDPEGDRQKELEKQRQEILKKDFNTKFTSYKIPTNQYGVKSLVLPKGTGLTFWKKNEDRVKGFFKSWEGSQWDSYIPKNKDFDFIFPDDTLRAFRLPDGEFFTGRVKRVSDNPLTYAFVWYYDENDNPYKQEDYLRGTEIPDDFLEKEQGFWDKWGGWIIAGLSMLIAATVPGMQGLLLSALIDLIQVGYSLHEGDTFGAVISAIMMFVPFIGASIKGLGTISKSKALELAEKFGQAESKAQVNLIYEGLSDADKILFRTVFSQDPEKLMNFISQKQWELLADGLKTGLFDKKDFVKTVNELIASGKIQYPELAKWWQKNPNLARFGLDLGLSGLVLLGGKGYTYYDEKKKEKEINKQIQKTFSEKPYELTPKDKQELQSSYWDED